MVPHAVRVSYQPLETRPLAQGNVDVKLLRRQLKTQAVMWVFGSIAIVLFPRWVFETIAGQPVLEEYVWAQAVGVMGIVLALLMVLVAQKIDELWWWSWSFAVLDVGLATLFVVNALFGTPDAAPAWPFWSLAVLNGVLGAGLLVGMGLGGQEKPSV